ncbi:hypothetical protein PI124_g13128 [Phytophthora idaei]|nr:hypothetical protein PI124_g13128 [Phytophthora idaei]
MSLEGRNTTSGLFTPAWAAQIRACLEEEQVNMKSRKISKVMAGLAKTLMDEMLMNKYTNEAPTDLTPTGIERLRWKMLLAVLKTRYVAE